MGLPLLGGLLGAACGGERPAPDASSGTNRADGVSPSPPLPEQTDPSQLHPGDRWHGLVVEAVDVRPEVVDSFGWMGRVQLSGSVTLSGSYRPHPDHPENAELCFFPDSASAVRLPRFPNDQRTSWLCFSNQPQAQQELGQPPSAGEATIVIDQFGYLYQHSDVYNTGRLQSVRSRS